MLFLWSDLEPAELWSSWARLSPLVAFEAFAVHCAICVVRSQRFRVLLPAAQRPSRPAMLAISASHNLAAYVLPAKTGELSLVMYLRGYGAVPATAGLAALFVSRLLDLATLCFSLSIATFYLAAARGELLPARFHLVALALLAASALLMYLSSRSDAFVHATAWVARRFGLARFGLGQRLFARAAELSAALRQAPAGRTLWIAAGQSLVMWLGIFVCYAIIARGFGLPRELGFSGAAFGSSLAVLTNLLPVNSFAGFGTQEVGWVLGFGWLGVPRDLALSTGLGVHLWQLASTIVIGILGHMAMGWLPRRPDSESGAKESGRSRVG